MNRIALLILLLLLPCHISADRTAPESKKSAKVKKKKKSAAVKKKKKPDLNDFGILIPPPDYNHKRSYPLVMALPYTGGRARNFLEYYLFTTYNRRLSLQKKWELTLKEHYPDKKERDAKSFFLFAPHGKGSKKSHSSSGFNWAVTHYEKKLLKGLYFASKKYNINRKKVVLAGHSLGGDLSWAISLRNPDKFTGAFISGSRTSYREDGSLERLKDNGFRYFFSMGAKETNTRLRGLSSSLTMLDRVGVAYQYFRAPGVAHLPPSHQVVLEALQYPLFGKELDVKTHSIASAPKRVDLTDENDLNNVPTESDEEESDAEKQKSVKKNDPILLSQSQENDKPIQLADQGLLLLPPEYNQEKSYPVVIILPYSGGTAKNFLEYYLLTGNSRSLPLQERWNKTFQEHYPEYDERVANGFFLFLPHGKGSSRDHSWKGFSRAISRFEGRIERGLKAAAKEYQINFKKIVLAGHALGGDLSWAIALRNPELFAGAFISGSRTSYREEENMDRLQKNNFRFFFSMGEKESKERLKGVTNSLQILKQAKIAYRYYRVPEVSNRPPSKETIFQALHFPLFGKNLPEKSQTSYQTQ